MTGQVRRFVVLALPFTTLVGCGVLWQSRCQDPIGDRWTEVRLAAAPDPELQRVEGARLFVSVVTDVRGRLDSSRTIGVTFRAHPDDATAAAQAIGSGWIRIDSLRAGLWYLQPFRLFHAEDRPFAVEAREGYADSIRVAVRYRTRVPISCR